MDKNSARVNMSGEILQNKETFNEQTAVEQELQELLSIDKVPSRFKVARVSVSELLPNRDVNRLTPTTIYGENLQSSSNSLYDSRHSRSLNQLTREVLPRAEHYRDITSVHHAQRPTLEELHEARFLEKDQRRKKVGEGVAEDKAQNNHKKGKVIKFGWVEGVYMRCLLNIWGVMLFLRLSWVIGQAGVGMGFAVIFLANIVTLATTLSMSAVSTNGLIEAGGIYYMISRSLGPEFGGAIGLMFTLANAVAVSMYIVGFCESVQDLLRMFGMSIIDNGTNDIRVVGVITLVCILILAFVGMDWVTRTQMVLLIVLIASQIDFVVGSIMGPKTLTEMSKGFVGYNLEVFKANLVEDYRYFEGVEHNFFSVFSVFFPAVTGIVAGANLSGDLIDPSKAIPRGTLLAILTTFVSYLSYALMMGGCVLRDATGNVTALQEAIDGGLSHSDTWKVISGTCSQNSSAACRYGLQNDNQAMELVSVWGPLIYGGCFAATLSSAIASLVGAPRVLQALAKDKLYPFIYFFSKGYGANNDPIRGYILVFCIAFGCVLIAQLNAIAPLLSNFFLAAYALINFSVFHASISKCPGWRPAFKYYNAWVSLIGTLLCIAVMFLISWWTALVTFFVVVTLYLYVSYRKPEVNWGSSTQAQAYNFALRSALELNRVAEHVKNYRPQVLALSGEPGSRPALIDFANLITKGNSLLICGHILKGSHSQRVHDALTQKAQRWLEQHRIKAFYAVTGEGSDGSGSFASAAESLMQLTGLGKLRPNTVLMGYKHDWQTCSVQELLHYFNLIHSALDSYLAVGILCLENGLDYSGFVQDKDVVLISSLDKKDAEEKLRRNQSAGQLSLDVMNQQQSADSSCSAAVNTNPDPSPADDAEPDSSVSLTESQPSDLFLGPSGEPLAPNLLKDITLFRRKQEKGFIDVWWLFDDGGLTLLVPHILRNRSQFADSKLRIFSLASRKSQLDHDQKNLAQLLLKFRIDYSDLTVISDINSPAKSETRLQFENLIDKFRLRGNEPNQDERKMITDNELVRLHEKTNRHLRLRELLFEHSLDSSLIIMTLPMPRKGTVSAPLYMAWLETLSNGLPPTLILRGNQTSVLTYYS